MLRLLRYIRDKGSLHNPLEGTTRSFARQGLVIDSQTGWEQIRALVRV